MSRSRRYVGRERGEGDRREEGETRLAVSRGGKLMNLAWFRRRLGTGDMMLKEDAAREMLDVIRLYSEDTRFFINAWTWG